MKIPLLKVGATGHVDIITLIQINDEPQKVVTMKAYNFTVRKIRSNDFIVDREGVPAPMFCRLPRNKSDGSEKTTLEPLGFQRSYLSDFIDSRGVVKTEIKTIYSFND